MYYKQKIAQPNHNLDLLHKNQQHENEERKLLFLWDQHAVQESYQNIVLAYLDKFNDRNQLVYQIKKEVKLTYTKSTHYFKIKNLLLERDKTIQYLYQWAVMLQQYKKLTQKNTPNLDNVCHLIDHLRKVHMLVCETVSEMFARYKCSFKYSKDIRAASYYLNIFATFNNELQFLKSSLLKFYMPFATGFDPLFLKQAQQIGKFYAEQKIVYDPDVEALFHINASYLYRLLRANQKMLEYLSIGQQIDDYDDTIDLKSNYDHTIEQDKIQMNPQRTNIITTPTHKQSRLVQTEPILIQQSTKPSRMHQYVNNHQYQKINKVKRNDVQSTQTNDLITTNQTKPLPRFNSNRQSQSELPKTQIQDKPNYIKIFKSERQKQRQTTIPSTPSARQQQSRSQRINTEVPKGLNNLTKKFSRQHEFYEEKQTPVRNPPKKTPYKKKSEPQIYLAQSNPKRNSLNNKQDKFHLPKIDQTVKNEDCLCRQRYKSKRPQRYEEEPQDQMTTRRKSIIKLINAKYRRLAQRQKRYELNKIKNTSLEKSRQNSRVTKMQRTNELSDNSFQKSSHRS